jgi:hypothetical protein
MPGQTWPRRYTHCQRLAGKGLHKFVSHDRDPLNTALMLDIVPIYLDHLVVPTLTDTGCYTEVHHIDGEGKDAG